MNSLGVAYYTGELGVKNHTRAIEWYNKAADKNSLETILNLAFLYHHGVREGKEYVIERNMTLAQEYYERAERMGKAHAVHYLGDFRY
jgi:TPR repeat protein